MEKTVKCDFCNYDFPVFLERCPHCARPGLFPNVAVAQSDDERDALEMRYQEALKNTRSRGCDNILVDFEQQVNSSHSVSAQDLLQLHELAENDNALYSTFYKRIEAGIALYKGTKWDIRRSAVDDAMFPGYKKEICFAALSLDGLGLSNYGNCFIEFRDDMIAHRASVFEENSVIFMKKHNIKIWDSDNLPVGYRAGWQERGKLAAAKVADDIRTNTTHMKYPGLLLRNGPTSEQDEFVEVHIWGPMTVRTMRHVKAKRPNHRRDSIFLKSITEKLEKAGVGIEVL